MTETGENKAANVSRKERVKVVQRFNPHETTRVESLAGVPLATFKQRFIAYSIDFLIAGSVAAIGVSLLMYFLIKVLHVQPELFDTTKEHVHLSAHVDFEKTNELVEAVAMLIYFGLSVWLTNGLTLGKRLMRIRVVSLTHEKITLWQSCERALGYGASALEAGFGFFQYFIYPNRTCVHDRIAETIVVQVPHVKKINVKKVTQEKPVELKASATESEPNEI